MIQKSRGKVDASSMRARLVAFLLEAARPAKPTRARRASKRGADAGKNSSTVASASPCQFHEFSFAVHKPQAGERAHILAG